MNETRGDIVYCGDVTAGIAGAAAFVTSFEEVVAKDSGDTNFGFDNRILNMSCIDMDAWEKSVAKDAKKTMDCVVGVSKFDHQRRERSSHRLLLVELKLNATSKKTTIGQSELKDKVNHSLEMLSGRQIDKHRIFLFTKEHVSKYVRELKSWQNGTQKNTYLNWKVLTPLQFNNFIAFEEDFPYKPINSKEKISNALISCIQSGDCQKLYDELGRWKFKLQDYGAKYMKAEAEHIRKVISETMTSEFANIPGSEDKDLIRMEYQTLFGFTE